MKKQDYDLLTRSNLSLACFEPVIKTYKNRVADQTSSNISQIQERFYKELTYGQRASVIYVYARQIVGFVLLGRPVIWLLIQLFTLATCLLTIFFIIIWSKNRENTSFLDKIRFFLLLAGGIVLVPWALYWQLLFL